MIPASLIDRPSRLFRYSPHQGFIGKQKLKVPSYLFATRKDPTGYQHCSSLAKLILNRTPEEHHRRGAALTRLMREREMTFTKLTRSGEYRIFDVPCTTTPLTLPKSVFNSLQKSAQALVATMRFLLQDIYGSESIRASAFVQSLPDSEREHLIQVLETSPQYFPQLHHPVMRDYPFFDVVGLDLVLADDLESAAAPFRLLEINAGSPSGASNNNHLLECLREADPEMLLNLDRIFPNDHFEVIAETYRSLGSTWTGRTDGVQIILPPGGANGAAPEIHQLAALSGLIYADPGQLHRDSDGNIRLRTASNVNPVVTAIYSRVNADSALYDRERGIFIRDQESGEPIYANDPILEEITGKPVPMRSHDGKPIPLDSAYAIPGAIAAIHERRLYLGGLNRLLDNKIILPQLCERAPLFFRDKLAEIGIDLRAQRPLSPPETLPSSEASLSIIGASPEEWVIKSPSLSGGKGVHILKTMTVSERRKALHSARKNPTGFAYQKLVRIGRLPVAVKERTGRCRIANLAADLRMWAFFGGGDQLPRLTHNGLARLAPAEKGPLSSIVNTSRGGGYAPMAIVDDLNSPEARPAQELYGAAKDCPSAAYRGDLPCFVGGQITQIAQMISYLEEKLRAKSLTAQELEDVLIQLKSQCREVLSFLHPRDISIVNELLDLVARRSEKRKKAKALAKRAALRSRLVTLMHGLEPELYACCLDTLERLLGEDAQEWLYAGTHAEDRLLVRKLAASLSATPLDCEKAAGARALARAAAAFARARPRFRLVSPEMGSQVAAGLARFSGLASETLQSQKNGRLLAGLFSRADGPRERIDFRILFAEETGSAPATQRSLIASEEELRTGTLIVDTDFIRPELRAARRDWRRIVEEASAMPASGRATYLARARESHFKKHPALLEYQGLLNSPATSSVPAMIRLLDILPYARYNLDRFAETQGITLRDLFAYKLTDRRIALLTAEDRKELGLNWASHAGECFAVKKGSHGLFSESQIFLWIATETHPAIQSYTAGHEIVHFQQISAMIQRERRSIEAGPAEFSRFLCFYGNFLGLSSGTLDNIPAETRGAERRPIFGFSDLLAYAVPPRTWVHQLKSALPKGERAWNELAASYGSLLGLGTEGSSRARVKAIREVIPALENAKNIRFVKDLGLEFWMDEIGSALPVANLAQLNHFQGLIDRAIYSPDVDWEALRVIANHQYYGVRLPHAANPEDTLTLRSELAALSLGGSYNQTQQ
ncbi:MAG: hypothetical protein NDJ89_07250 [Oligoflexia bacterium]|nr:hypothetical protein [Oligoflexia bacterium]